MNGKREKTDATAILFLSVGLLIAAVLLAVMLFTNTAQAKPASVLMQEGLYAEEVEGNLDAAIEIYQKAVKQAARVEKTAARATYRIGMCYLKKGEKERAADYFEQITTKFPQQKALATRAQSQLSKLRPPVNQKLTFGEVIERVIYDPRSSRECFFDFESGKVYKKPDIEESKALEWFREKGIDVNGDTSGSPSSHGLVGFPPFHPAAIHAPMGWNASADTLVEMTKHLTPSGKTKMFAKEPLPTTYYFKTQQGNMGVLQILGFTEGEPRGVRFRYKILQEGVPFDHLANEIKQIDHIIGQWFEYCRKDDPINAIELWHGGKDPDFYMVTRRILTMQPDWRFEHILEALFFNNNKVTVMSMGNAAIDKGFGERSAIIFEMVKTDEGQWKITDTALRPLRKWHFSDKKSILNDYPYAQVWQRKAEPALAQGDPSKAVGMLTGLKGLFGGVIKSLENDDTDTALKLTRQLIDQSQELEMAVKGTEVEASIKTGRQMLVPLREALKQKDLKRAKSFIDMLNAMGPGIENFLIEQSKTQSKTDRRDASSVAQAFLAAVISGRDGDAIALVKPGSAVVSQVRDFQQISNIGELKLVSMYTTNQFAQGVTNKIKIEDEQGQLLFHLVKNRGIWMVDDIDLENPDSLKDEINSFLKRHTDAEKVMPRQGQRVTIAQVPDPRTQSPKSLSRLGKAMAIYANDDERGRHADNLRQIWKGDYLNMEDVKWLSENAEYLGKGKTAADPPNTILAYDKSLLQAGKGTNVLFNDTHVEFVKPDRLRKLGITGELRERAESLERLGALGNDLAIYANDDEQGRYPDTLSGLTNFHFMKMPDYEWAREFVEYLGKGKTAADIPNAILAYDKYLLQTGKGTNVLYNDTHVEFVESERLEEMGIKATPGRAATFEATIYDNMGLDLDTGAGVSIGEKPDQTLAGLDVAWDNDGGGALMVIPKSKARIVVLPGATNPQEAINSARASIDLLRKSESKGIFAKQSKFVAVLTDQGNLAVIEITSYEPEKGTIEWRLEKIPASVSPYSVLKKRVTFLPDADHENVNAILDLASGEMLRAGPEKQQLTIFRDLGKGDLAWDRVLICLRGAKAKLSKEGKLLNLIIEGQRGDLTAYKLDSVPCRLLVTTAEGDKYEVTVLHVSESGINLEYGEIETAVKE